MSDLLARIRAAQVNAGELAVCQDLHDKGLCDPKSCPVCVEAFRQATLDDTTNPIVKTLEDKLAVMLWYLEEVRRCRRSADPIAFESYLDDHEVAAWLDRMNKSGRIRNTRFTGK